MITKVIMDFVTAFLGVVTSAIPTTDAPAWITDASGYLATVFAAGAGLGAWLPWSLIGTVLTAVLVCVGIGFSIKVVRIIASFLLVGGGSAG